MNNRITNKLNNDKLNSKIKKEETKNSLYNSKINEQEIYSTNTILNKKKKLLFPKKLKHMNIGINFNKLIISTKRNNNYNSSPQNEPINRNFSYNNVILIKKNNNLNNNNSQSLLSKSNKKKDIIIPKNLKNSSNNYNSKNNHNNSNINKGKTYFGKILKLPQEMLEKSMNQANKSNNNSVINNEVIQSYENSKTSTNNNNSKIIFKNNSFTSQNKNIILIQSNRIKNCYTNLIINKNDSNKGKNKIKSIPFSLKKNKQKINTNTENYNNNNNNNNIKDYYATNDEMIHRIYKNEKLLKNNMNKEISAKTKCNNEIFLTDKNNEKRKKTCCLFNKKINISRKKGLSISPSKQSIEFTDNNSVKMIKKFDLNDESKIEGNNKNIDDKKKNNNKSKISKIKTIHKNEKTRFIIKNNNLNKNNIIKNKKNKEKNENNNSKASKINILKNSSFTKKNFINLNQTENNVKKSISKNDINKNGYCYNNKNNKNTETIKDVGEEEDEVIETIEDSLRNSNIFKEVNVFHTSHIYSKTISDSCLKIISVLLDKDNIIETFINFCNLDALNKLCLISKHYYNRIKPIIYKKIMQKVIKYSNKMSNNSHNNKIKKSLLKYSSLSKMSRILLEKKYKDLLFENNSTYDVEIKKDLTRTILGDSSFQYGNENYNKLYHLLTAYSNYNKNIGYAQGLNFLAANCIFLFEKEIDEFLFLDALIQKFNLEYIIGVSNNLIIKLEGVSNCLNKYIPKIKNFLGNMNLNYEFFIAGWVLTLFSNSMNNHYLFYIWDYMIIFGWDYFNCFIIAVLKRYENDILSVPQNKLTFYMKNILRNITFQKDFEEIIKSSFDYLLKEKIFK